MGHKKLIKKLTGFFSMGARERQKKQEDLRALLDRLKEKETQLKARLEAEEDAEVQQELEQKIKLVHGQRKKGVAMLKELVQENRADDA